VNEQFTASVWREGEWHVAQCLEVDIASQGTTENEALANLQKALELQFTPPVASVVPRIYRIEVEMGGSENGDCDVSSSD